MKKLLEAVRNNKKAGRHNWSTLKQIFDKMHGISEVEIDSHDLPTEMNDDNRNYFCVIEMAR